MTQENQVSSKLPPKLSNLLRLLGSMDRRDRMETLIDLAGKFKDPPARVALRPFPESHRVPGCESEAYVWAEPAPGNTLKFYFAVENPQGISAKATAVILDMSLSGTPLDVVAAVPTDVIFEIFGRELSMGKNLGLTNMLVMCQTFARRCLDASARLVGRPNAK